jgi:nucleotide-binding universal stress UspA family protein
MNENGSWNGGPMVVVGVDGSAGSLEALRWALEEARLRNAPLRAIHSWILLLLGSRGHAAKEQPWTSA